MTAAKIAISIDPLLLKRIDTLVESKQFRSRSEMFQAAVKEQLQRFDDELLALECAKLNVEEERAMADFGLSTDFKEWPAY